MLEYNIMQSMMKHDKEQLEWLCERIPDLQELFDFMLTEQMPERLIGDKAYDSDKLDEQMAERGIEMISPHRGNRKPENKTQDGRPLRRYKRRWTVERTIGWLQHYRRLCIHWERSTVMFQGFLHWVASSCC